MDRKGDRFAQTSAAVLVVILCLGKDPLGCVWEGRERGVCEVKCEVWVRRSCSETDAVKVFWRRVALEMRERK